MPQPQNHDNAQHSHHPRTQNHHHEQLLAGWEWVQLQNGKTTPTPPPSQTEQQRTRQLGDRATRGRRGNNERKAANEKKAQETSNNVSWAICKFCFFSHFIILLLTNFLSIN
jgi:hypothetical protein